MKKAKRDIYAEVTQAIVAELETGTLPWTKPFWVRSSMPIRSNGEPYKGINVFILALRAMREGYTSTQWFTYKQAQAAGGQVRKGETGTGVVFFKTYKKEDKKTGDDVVIPVLRNYTVFNVDQIDGIEQKKPEREVLDHSPIERAEKYFTAVGAKVRHDAAVIPCYVPSRDEIALPPIGHFHSPEAYYSTLGHEHVHWTGHKSRLKRLDDKSKEGYAFEELIAETGAALLMPRVGLEPLTREDHAPYIAGWIKALNDDKKLFFKAAARAQDAVDFLDGLQTETKEAA